MSGYPVTVAIVAVACTIAVVATLLLAAEVGIPSEVCIPVGLIALFSMRSARRRKNRSGGVHL